MAVLFFIAMSYRNYIIKEGKAPYLTVMEILPVIEAFSEKMGLSVYEDVWEERKLNGEEYVTVGEVRTLLNFFSHTESVVLEEYEKDSWYIGVEDWNRILSGLVEVYGGEEIIFRTVALMGTDREVTDEMGNKIENMQVLTNIGVMNTFYWNTEEYMYSTATVVCRGMDILTITGYADTPIIEKNVYLAGGTEAECHLFTGGYHIRYLLAKEEGTDLIIENADNLTGSELVDLSFERGTVSLQRKDMEYINGKLLQISGNGMEIEGHGFFKAADEMAVYRLYGEMSSMKVQDLRIGYDFTDFVVENGKIAACLVMKDEDMKYIRVLLKNTNYAGQYHEKFTAVCDQDYDIVYYENGIEIKREEKKEGESFAVTANDLVDGSQRIKMMPKVLSAQIRVDTIGRSQGIPSYKGCIEITGGEEGLSIVNEVLLEDYLRYVVPSEMPSGYPKEALMAQAVCARTYAYGKMLNAGLPSLGAHVDDSAGFQVYNNIKEQDSTTEAVRATHNRIAVYQGEPIGTYYYSTSSGAGTDATVWHGSGESPAYLTSQIISPDNGEGDESVKNDETAPEKEQRIIKAAELSEEDAFREWIQNTDTNHFESQEGWYRWSYDVEKMDVSHMEEVLKQRYEGNPELILTQNEDGEFESREVDGLGKILSIEVTKRLSGGVADELLITGSKAVIKVMSELNIRYVLSDGNTKVLRQSGDYVDASSTLPSAFIMIEMVKDGNEVTGYSIKGGGFGHGVGMSQNGAKNMAEEGMTYEQILGFFYQGSEIEVLEFKE